MNFDDVVGRVKFLFDIGIVLMVDFFFFYLIKLIILINE